MSEEEESEEQGNKERVEELRKLIEENETNESNRLKYLKERGYLYYKSRDYDNAILDYSKVLEIEPENYYYYHIRGTAYYHLGDYEKSVSDYTRAIGIKRKALHLFNRGVSFKKLGKLPEAIDDFEKCIEKFGDKSVTDRHVVHSELGDCFRQQSRFKDSLEELNKSIDIKETGYGYYFRGLRYFDSNMYHLALLDFKKCLDEFSNCGCIKEATIRLQETKDIIAEIKKTIEKRRKPMYNLSCEIQSLEKLKTQLDQKLNVLRSEQRRNLSDIGKEEEEEEENEGEDEEIPIEDLPSISIVTSTNEKRIVNFKNQKQYFEIEALEKKLSSTISEKRSLEDKVSELTTEKLYFEKKAETDRSFFISEKKYVETLIAKIKNLNSNLSKLDMRIQNEIKTNSTLKRQRDEAKDKCENQKENISQLQRQLLLLTSKKDSFIDEVKNLTEKVKDLETENSQMEKHLKCKMDTITEIERQIEEIRTENTKLLTEKLKISSDLKDWNIENAKLKAKNRDLKEDYKEGQNSLEKIKEFTEVKLKLFEDDLQREIEIKNKKLKEQREEYERKTGELEKKHKMTIKRIHEVHSRVIDGLTSRNKSLDRELREKKENVRKYEEGKRLRLSRKLQELDNEEFYKFNATSFIENEGSLEFHHNLSTQEEVFICKFKSNQSKFRVRSDFEDEKLADAFFENVTIDLEKDKVLFNFVDETKQEHESEIHHEMIQKSLNNHTLKKFVQQLCDRVIMFFKMPTPPKQEIEEYLNEYELKMKQMFDSHVINQDISGLTDEQLVSKYIKLRIPESIESSQFKNGGNTVYLGDLKECHGKCRHRALLFKLICDSVGIKCKLQFVPEFHAWNLVQVKNEFYYIDTMNFGNELIRIEEYPNRLRTMLEGDDHDDVRNAIERIILESTKERLRIEKLKLFFQRSDEEQYDELFRVKPKAEGGGGGKISKCVARKDILSESGQVLFHEGEVIAIKRIIVDENAEIPENGIVPKTYALREASYMKMLDHSSIIDIIGFWDQSKEVYIAMKSMNVNGKEFSEKLASKQFPTYKKHIESLFVFLEVCRGLRYLKTLNIVHLDLKPENIMICMNEETGEVTDVKIIDFGGAKNVDLKSSVIYRTDEYSAPEIEDHLTKKEILRRFNKLKKMFDDREEKGKRFNMSDMKDLVKLIARDSFGLKFGYSGVEDVYEYIEKKYESSSVSFQKTKPIEFNMFYTSYYKYWKQMNNYLVQLGSKKEVDDRDFDCRADTFSLGVMMEKFVKRNLLPPDLGGLKDRCIREDRKERPLIGEIIFILRKHLSFFNQRTKSEMELL